jgi:hypothetical protein
MLQHVKKALANWEPSTHGTLPTSRNVAYSVAIGAMADFRTWSENDAIDPSRTSANISCCSSEAGFSPIKALV